MPYYHECPECHSNLDPNEICHCDEEGGEELPENPAARMPRRGPQERKKAAVCAAGNRRATENVKAAY